jgi:hypothetical protein
MPNTKIQAPKYKKIPKDNIQKLLSSLNPEPKRFPVHRSPFRIEGLKRYGIKGLTFRVQG